MTHALSTHALFRGALARPNSNVIPENFLFARNASERKFIRDPVALSDSPVFAEMGTGSRIPFLSPAKAGEEKMFRDDVVFFMACTFA
jgi:hypothetical protein